MNRRYSLFHIAMSRVYTNLGYNMSLGTCHDSFTSVTHMHVIGDDQIKPDNNFMHLQVTMISVIHAGFPQEPKQKPGPS